MVRSIIIAALIGLSGPTFAQDSASVKLLNYRKNVLQEKMFVHIDRDVYVTGETMWLKIYTVDATLHRPIDISKVAYVEIVDADNNSLVREKIALSEGVGSGTLFLPASISTGNYLVRAYTSWMQNFSADFFFKKPVSIVNAFVKLDQPAVAANKASTHQFQFFPEGGTLLAGVPNRIGFKGSVGEFRGALIEEGGSDTIVHFKPLKFGMGSFDFTPASGKKYRAIVRAAGSPASNVGLPDVTSEGYALRVVDKGNVLSAEVTFLPAMQNGPAVFLFVHTRQQMVKAERKSISQGKALFEIKKSDLKDGISHITLFDDRSRPLAERLFFKAPANVINITLQSGQSEYRTRTKVQLDLQTNRAVSQMSVAVYRLDSLAPTQSPTHISDYFYLTSDLRGLVESPQYYFGNDAEAVAAADNLMLTQGWRRFTWADLSKKPVFTYAPEYNGHLVRGITKDMNGNVVPSIFTYAAVPGRIIDMYPSRSNSKGEVTYEMKHFIGGQKILVYADSSYKVELQSPFSTAATTASLPELRLQPSVEKNLLARSVGMQVDKIYNEEHYATPVIDSAAFYGAADETYFLDDYTRFPVMEEVFREYVPGVNVRKQGGDFKFFLHDTRNKKMFYETPMILLDGVPLFDVNKVMAYDPLNVKKLEVLTRKFYHGLGTYPGIISFTTYKGDLNGFELDARYVNLDYEGLQLQREFYSPVHDYEKENEARLPDQRSLLYWNANLATDDTGKQSPLFYTSDVQGTYQVVVEGMTKDGASGFATYIFKVKGIK